MKKLTIIALFSAAILLLGFGVDNPFFRIASADVRLVIPAGFPQPVYRFAGNAPSPAVFLLGRKLFYDPILSKDSTISCSSCHQRIAAFGHIDHALSHGINGLIGKRNVPALQNLIWKSSFMWDGGVNHLEIQPLSPITNPVEMNEDIAHVLVKLRAHSGYRREFAEAFGDTLINSERLLKALAQFTGLMISAGSRYDHYLQGADSLSAKEKAGLALFRAKCGSCHREPLFTDNSFRNNGLPPDSLLRDRGRGKITGLQEDDYKFQVPSLRNVERTYPYMHDGRFRTLTQVLDYYGDPAHFSAGSAPELRMIGYLSAGEKEEMIAFLRTLTDMAFIYDKRFYDPFMQ